MEAIASSAAEATPVAGAPSASQKVSEIAARSVAAFGEIIERLDAVRTVSADLSGDLDSLAGFAGTDAASEDLLPKVHGLLSEFNHTLDDDGAESGDVEVLRNLAVARDYVGRIHRFALTLSAVATMSRTTTASLGIDALRGYFEELTQTATVIGTSASEIGLRIEDVRKSIVATSEGLSIARNGLLSVVPHVEASIERETRLAADEAHEANRVRDRARRLCGEAQELVKSFDTATGFSDQKAQRLAHIKQMLEDRDGHVARLAAAQCRALASDIRIAGDGFGNAIATLSQFGRNTKSLFTGAEVSSAIETSLSNRSEIGSTISGQLAGFRKALKGVRERGEECTQAFEAMGESLGVLERASKSVALAAVNSTIFASRSGDARGPLATLSLEVRDTATRCLEAVVGTQSATDAAITKNRESARVLVDSGTALDETVQAYQSETERSEERFTRLSELRGNAEKRAASLLELSDTMRGAAHRINECSNALEALATELDGRPAEGPADSALMTKIFETYTTDEERRVHAEVLAKEDAPPPADGEATPTDAAA